MKQTRILMDRVLSGQSVGEWLWKEAMKEIEEVEKRTLVPVDVKDQPPKVSFHGTDEQVIELLGRLFIILEDFMVEMRRKGAYEYLRGDVADVLLDAKQYLKDKKYEIIVNRDNDPMTFTNKDIKK